MSFQVQGGSSWVQIQHRIMASCRDGMVWHTRQNIFQIIEVLHAACPLLLLSLSRILCHRGLGQELQAKRFILESRLPGLGLQVLPAQVKVQSTVVDVFHFSLQQLWFILE